MGACAGLVRPARLERDVKKAPAGGTEPGLKHETVGRSLSNHGKKPPRPRTLSLTSARGQCQRRNLPVSCLVDYVGTITTPQPVIPLRETRISHSQPVFPCRLLTVG